LVDDLLVDEGRDVAVVDVALLREDEAVRRVDDQLAVGALELVAASVDDLLVVLADRLGVLAGVDRDAVGAEADALEEDLAAVRRAGEELTRDEAHRVRAARRLEVEGQRAEERAEELRDALLLQGLDARGVPLGVRVLGAALHVDAVFLGPELLAELLEHLVRVDRRVRPRVPRRVELLHVDAARLVAGPAARLLRALRLAGAVRIALVAVAHGVLRGAHELPAALVDVEVEDAVRLGLADDLDPVLREAVV